MHILDGIIPIPKWLGFSLKLRCLRLGRLRGFTLCLSGAVNHFGWLSPTQMIDGLALGETTPGPLIMVVAFVGF